MSDFIKPTKEEVFKLFDKMMDEPVEHEMKSSDQFYQGVLFAIWMLAKPDKYRWHDLRSNPSDLPEPEREVDVRCQRYSGMIIVTHGMYENGKVHSDESEWNWSELDDFAEYCEETGDYIIPEGWWEYRHYNDGENFNFRIDDTVIAWREIEPFEEEEDDG